MLWSWLVLPCSPELFRLFRDRSGTVPIILHISNNSSSNSVDMEKLGDPLCQVASRISELKIEWDLRDHEISWWQFLDRHTRQREFSSLKVLEIYDSSWDETVPVSVLNTPVLQTLIFRGFPTSLPRVRVDNLIELRFDSEELSPSQILDMLEGLPSLEHCSISDDDAHPFPGVQVVHPVVSLPRLQTLCLDYFYTDVAMKVFMHLDLPPYAMVTALNSEPPLEKSGTSLTEVIRTRLLSSSEFKIVQQRRCIDYTFGAHAQHSLRISHGQPLSEFRVQVEKPVSLVELAASPANLSRIILHMEELPALADLVQTLRSWPLLSHFGIRTQVPDFERLLNALEETPDILCPLLKSLDCTGTRFSGPRMKFFLQFRKAKGVPIENLHFTSGFSDVKAGDLASLLAQVSETDPSPMLKA